MELLRVGKLLFLLSFTWTVKLLYVTFQRLREQPWWTGSFPENTGTTSRLRVLYLLVL